MRISSRGRVSRSPLNDPWIAVATTVAVLVVALVVVLFVGVLVASAWTTPLEVAAGRTWAA